MERKFWKSVGTMVLPCVFTMLMVQACMNSNNAAAVDDSVDPLEGTWAEQVTLRNCDSGAVLTSFRATSMFNHGGTMNNFSNQPPTLFGPSSGTWSRQVGSYNNVFRFYTFAPDGSFSGTRTVTRAITLDEGSNSFTATISAEVRDPSDAVVAMVCGTQTGARA